MSIVGFYGVTNFKLSGNHLFQSAAYQANIVNSTKGLIDNEWYETVSTLGNLTRDGIDIRGPSDNITIRKLRGKSGDDTVALNSRPYTSLIVGPFSLGGNISQITLEDI